MQALLSNMKLAVGSSVNAVETPACIIDLAACEHNNIVMNEFCKRHGVLWRAHAKVHKSSVLAMRQIAAGSNGVCVQKTGEAVAMFNGGVRDIYISNEVIDPRKLKRVAQLSKQCTISIVVDSEEGLNRLIAAVKEEGSTVRVLVDLNIGHGRCGTSVEAAVDLIEQIKKNDDSLVFVGIHAYHGSAQHVRDFEQRKNVVMEAAKVVKTAKYILEQKYSEPVFVTGGGTGTMCFDVHEGVWNEIQPGSYLLGDVDYGLNDWGTGYLFKQALFIHTQVISASPNHVVVDAGNKSHSLDAGVEPIFAKSYDYLSWRSGGDEHGIAFSREANKLPEIGEVLDIIPGHIDPTINLYDAVYGYQDGIVTEIIEIDARGRSD